MCGSGIGTSLLVMYRPGIRVVYDGSLMILAGIAHSQDFGVSGCPVQDQLVHPTIPGIAILQASSASVSAFVLWRRVYHVFQATDIA